MKATILGPANIRIPSTAEHVAETGIHAARDVDTGYDPYRVVRGCVVDGPRGLRPRAMGWVCSAYLENAHQMDAVENDLLP